VCFQMRSFARSAQAERLSRARFNHGYREEMRRGALPLAIIAANDHVALDILDTLEEFGDAAVRSVSLLGFDDLAEPAGVA